jgi:hypothetical protein
MNGRFFLYLVIKIKGVLYKWLQINLRNFSSRLVWSKKFLNRQKFLIILHQIKPFFKWTYKSFTDQLIAIDYD